MTGPRLQIRHPDGTTDELTILAPDAVGDTEAPSLQSLSIERKIARNPDECDRAECRVYRDAWQSLGINPIDDRFIIVDGGGADLFGGRLRDTQRGGVTVSVILDDAKRDALDAAPSGGNDIYDPQPDDQLVTGELLPRVPTLGPGTITEQTGSIAFSESQASPGASITKLAEPTGSETLYRPDFTLDYVGRLGSDRTDETLSPSAGTLIGEPRVREQTVEDVTRIRVLGAQQGTAQVTAEAVVDDTTEREVYRQKSDKDIQQAGRAQALADELAAEYQDAPEYLEVETEIPASVAPSLGDSFRLALPAYDIDADLRIMTLERILDEAGDRFRAVLSNRKLTRDLEGERQQRSVEEFRGGNAGQIVRDSDSQGFDKVDDGEPMGFSLDYPSGVIDEYEATLRIESQPFRRPAAATGHSHGFSVSHPSHRHNVNTTSANNADFSNVATQASNIDSVTVPSSGDVIVDSFQPSVNTTGVRAYLGFLNKSATQETVYFELQNNDTGFIYPDSSQSDVEIVGIPLAPGEYAWWNAWDHTNCNGETLTIRASSTTGQFNASTAVWWEAPGRHTHGVFSTTSSELGTTTSSTTDSETSLQPGIITEDDRTPSNVAVTVGGQQVASALNHPIDETIDISGALDAGPNAIEATSDTLGELRLSVTIEALKNASQ